MTHTDDIMGSLGDVIRARRRQLNLTQQDIADLTGLARYTVIRVEAGDQNVRIETLDRVANAVGLIITLSTQYREA